LDIIGVVEVDGEAVTAWVGFWLAPDLTGFWLGGGGHFEEFKEFKDFNERNFQFSILNF
jgi:hypothetical protein